MPVARQTKPVIDAVNDTIGTLSDLLASLRAHAKQAKAEARASARTVKATAIDARRRTVRKVGAAGDGLLDKAAKVWHDITGDGKAGVQAPPARRTRRPRKR